MLGENRQEHYCLLRRVQRKDFKRIGDYRYAQVKQELQVNDLKRYGIVGLLVDDFSEYTDVLRRISYRYKLARVFISGSAAEYDPWSAQKGQELIQLIARGLISKGFGVVSGFGQGVGPFVLNGVLQELDNEGTRMLGDRVVLRPFPTAIADPAERKRRWSAYRDDILNHAGVAIFLFGNKAAPGGGISEAEGVEEEFRLAVEKGLFVVPVGSTGSMAATLHRRVMDNFTEYYPSVGYRQLFASLGRPGSPYQVASRVLRLIEKLRENRAISRNGI